MIEHMVLSNNGECYTNAEYERIERQRREGQDRQEEEECQKRKLYEEELLSKVTLLANTRSFLKLIPLKTRKEEQQKVEHREY